MIAVIKKSLIDEVRSERIRRLPRETGGFLIGFRRGQNIEVTEKTEQGRFDIATRSSFDRLDPRHRLEVHRAWAVSAGTKCLVGDWHTHPNRSASPSQVDLAAWRQLQECCKKPVIGLIDVGCLMPRIFAISGTSGASAIELHTFDESRDYITYAY